MVRMRKQTPLLRIICFCCSHHFDCVRWDIYIHKYRRPFFSFLFSDRNGFCGYIHHLKQLYLKITLMIKNPIADSFG